MLKAVVFFVVGLIGFLSAQSLERYNIDRNQISVGGVSSGGAQAIQFHVSYSSLLMGVAAIAAPPYWCANANLAVALSACMVAPAGIVVPELWAATKYAEELSSIDPTRFMEGDKVWLYSGKLDSVVYPGVVEKTRQYYAGYVNASNIKTVFNISSEHSYVTNNYGNPCNYLGSPYISNCGFDSAESFFTHFYGNLKPKTTSKQENLVKFAQGIYTPFSISPSTISMGSFGYLYVPTACKSKKTPCKLHIAFHGCDQDVSDIGDSFYSRTGINDWAESNNIIVLYPQAIHSNSLPFNPQGCWDWWGYTGPEYAVKLAPQIDAVKNMLDALTGP